MDEKLILRKNPDVVARVIDDETILLPIFKSSEEANCIYSLDKTGSVIWKMIDGKKTLGSIKKAILKEFDATPAEVDKEMKKFLKDLKETKALI